MSEIPRSTALAPHFAMVSVGYVIFAYASVPGVVRDRFGASFVSVGLLMSAILLSFSVVQLPAGRLLDHTSSIRVAVGALVAHAGLSIALDFAPTFEVLLALRVAWGLAGGLILTAGATHFDRLYSGSAATRQQGVFGGMATVGGAVAFLLTPSIVELTGWVGVHTASVPVAVAAVALYLYGGRNATVRRRTDGYGGAVQLRTLLARPPRPGRAVWLAGFCYVAVLGGYITLSTFVTAYFSDIGVVTRLNAAVLLVASLGRIGGGVLVEERGVDDARTIGVSLAVAVVGFLALMALSGPILVVLPFLTILAVSGPFGAVFSIAGKTVAVDERGTALSVVIAVGNFAALILPIVTGFIREMTGGYRAAFGLLALVCAIAALAGISLGRLLTRESAAA